MTMENLSMKHIVLTPSYPQNTSNFVKVWVPEIIDWIRNNSMYFSVFLEHPESNAHLDINVWWDKKKRWDNYSRGLKTIVKKFLEENPASEFQQFFFASKIPPTREDTLYLIGYNQKEERGLSNLPDELKAEGLEYYLENIKTKKVRKFMNTNPLNPKNVVCYLMEQSMSLKINEPEKLIHKMITEGFSFVSMGKKTMRKAILEFKIRTGQSSQMDIWENNAENGCYEDKLNWLEKERLVSELIDVYRCQEITDDYKKDKLYELMEAYTS